MSTSRRTIMNNNTWRAEGGKKRKYLNYLPRMVSKQVYKLEDSAV